jgi:predicted metal-dependent enzyme (double-stranded beta helix superfamily)
MVESLSRRSVLAGAAGLLLSGRALSQTHRNPAAAGTFNVDRFIDDVKTAGAETDRQQAIEEVLRRALSQPRAVLAELGEPKEAGIHTLHRADDLTILNVVWAPLMVLLPHNHNMWAAIGIYTGRADNILWQREGDIIEARGAASLSEQEVFGLPQDAIHSVTNPIGQLTGAIHIYGGDFFLPGRSEWDAKTLHERPFDLEAAREEFTKAAKRYNSAL